MKLKIRKSSFDTLYNNVLSINFPETWDCYETNDNSKNPLIVFETKKWNKLIKLCKKFINKPHSIYDLEVGSIKEIIYQYEGKTKWGK